VSPEHVRRSGRDRLLLVAGFTAGALAGRALDRVVSAWRTRGKSGDE
jgi:hypothetical protein